MSNPLAGADGRVTFESIMGFMKRGNRDRIGGPKEEMMGDGPADKIWAFERNDERYWRDEPCVLGVPYVRADLVPQWQPIETAPKDRPILLGRKGDLPVLAYWSTPMRVWAGWPWTNTPPTHWQPLPSPPPAQAENETKG